MPRPRIHFILLSVWLFAIFAPPIISLACEKGDSFIALNLNEEEKHEQGKKDIDEQLIVEQSTTTDFSLHARLWNSASFTHSLLGNSDYLTEIILPPPEKLI